MKRHRYDRQGLLALEPRAFFDLFFEPVERENEIVGDAAVVAIRGPLESHRGWWCDSYDAILDRVQAACAGPAKAVVLRIDSPGGDVAGMLDAARSIRAACDAAGKRLLAYVDGKACSAAYGLACVADSIVVDDAAIVGSIGVISARVDATAQAAMYGVKVALVTSGARKADGHPQAPITEAELAETQTIIDSLARPFFEHVAAHRELNAETIASLEARIFAGADAVRADLADAVGTFDQVLAMASADTAASAEQEEKPMSAARKALQAIIDDEKASDEDKDEARKALAAMDDDDSDEKEGKAKAEGGGDKDETDKAESDGDGDEPEKKGDKEAKAAASASAAQAASTPLAAADVESIVDRKLQAERDAAERQRLIDSRPDLSASTKKLLASQPLETVREYVEKEPRRALKPAATAVVGGARGEGQVDGSADRMSPDEARAWDLDRRMGLDKTAPKVRMEGNRQVLPLMTASQARAALAAREKEQSAR